MEKRKWLWKRKSSEKSPGETESSGSISSHSERYSDEQLEQEEWKETSVHITQSPDVKSTEVTSKAALNADETTENAKKLTAKLSAALINVSAKEDLVKQHAKVAEEAVAGWEKAENEVAMLKQQLEAAVQQNLALEVRVSHLDSALKECVRQLRQAKEDQEQKVHDVVVEKTSQLESVKAELENQLVQLKTNADAYKSGYTAFTEPDVLLKLESLEKENSILKLELLSRSEELEIRTIERDLSAQAAETASKQQLESIKKVAKIEAECRRLQAISRKFSSNNDHRSTASSVHAESIADNQPESGEWVNTVDASTRKWSKLELNDSEGSCSDSWASALIAELDQFKNDKAMVKNLPASSIDMDIMDDFLEMERLAALPEDRSKISFAQSKAVAKESSDLQNALKDELDIMKNQVAELKHKLEKIEAEKTELENALSDSQDSLRASQLQLTEAETKLEELQKELAAANESKELLQFQLIGMEVEARTLSANVYSLKTQVEKERNLSAEMTVKYQHLEDELLRKSQEIDLQQTASSNNELKIKQEDLVVAADKLAECQKTIASLGRQLESLATLEDFLIDTANIPGIVGGMSLIPSPGTECKYHPNGTYVPKRDSDPSKMPGNSSDHLSHGNEGESPASSSSSTSSTNNMITAKNRNRFVRLFTQSKSAMQLENQQG